LDKRSHKRKRLPNIAAMLERKTLAFRMISWIEKYKGSLLAFVHDFLCPTLGRVVFFGFDLPHNAPDYETVLTVDLVWIWNVMENISVMREADCFGEYFTQPGFAAYGNAIKKARLFTDQQRQVHQLKLH
jgi:hypothetical protein